MKIKWVDSREFGVQISNYLSPSEMSSILQTHSMRPTKRQKISVVPDENILSRIFPGVEPGSID
jgi:hypothetical protein